MIVRLVTISVLSGKEKEFEAATEKNVRGSLQEPGVYRFDLLRDVSETGRYYLYEVYRDGAAVEEHKQTEHYATWNSAVADMMAVPRSSVSCDVVAPTDPQHWRTGT